VLAVSLGALDFDLLLLIDLFDMHDDAITKAEVAIVT